MIWGEKNRLHCVVKLKLNTEPKPEMCHWFTDSTKQNFELKVFNNNNNSKLGATQSIPL